MKNIDINKQLPIFKQNDNKIKLNSNFTINKFIKNINNNNNNNNMIYNRNKN